MGQEYTIRGKYRRHNPWYARNNRGNGHRRDGGWFIAAQAEGGLGSTEGIVVGTLLGELLGVVVVLIGAVADAIRRRLR